MKEETIRKYNEIIEAAKASNKSVKKYCEENGISYGNVYSFMRKQSNNKSEVEIVRDENNMIIEYKVVVYRQDKTPFKTILSRQDAETLWGLYTYYGGNVTARNVANEFPKYTLPEVKYLFRAFGITKDSMWAPQHLIEELTLEELSQYRMNLKERAAFKYADAQQERDFNNQIKKMASEINHLNDKNAIVESLLGPINYDKVSVKSSKKNHNLTGIICLADLHIGAFNVPEGYIDLPEYSETEINRRLDIIINYIKNKKWGNIILLNLGDNVDSYKKMTSSMTHQLPCVNTDREIAQMYLRVMMRFVNQVKQLINKVTYISIGSGNHSSTWGWLLDITLSQQLKSINVESYVSSNEIDSFDVNGTSFVFLHGKSDNTKGQFKGFPLNLNEKTQCWFNDFFADTNLKLQKKKVVLKGDLHQYSINSVSSFDYINCPSIYGSSTYIVSNFGKTPWGCAYLEVDNTGFYMSGLIRE